MPSEFTTAELAKCARDEVYKRRQVYPRRVEQGRMSRNWADRELAMMQKIADQLERDAENERLL